MIKPLAIEPDKLNRMMYEKRVPLTRACIKIFSKINVRISLTLSFLIDMSMGKFARPRRKKGRGFGIAYSTTDRNMQMAAKNEILSIGKTFFSDIRIIFSLKNYGAES